MERNPANDISEIAGYILVHVHEAVQEKFDQHDFELILQMEADYVTELLLTLNTPGPIDVLINPQHQLASLAHACLLKGLVVEEHELAEIFKTEERYFRENGEDAERQNYDFNFN